MTRSTPWLAVATAFALLAPWRAWADTETSKGTISVNAWDPVASQASDSVQQRTAFDGMTLPPMALSSSGHPFDPPGTSGAVAQLSFDRPPAGEAVYHSFAAGYAFSYTPELYDKSAHTLFTLEGWLRILPPDVARLLGLLPRGGAVVRMETLLSLHGLFVAEAGSGSSPADSAEAGVIVHRTLDKRHIDASVTLHASNGGDPVITSTGFLDGDVQPRSFAAAELDTMFDAAMTSFGLQQARGGAMLSVDRFTEDLLFETGSRCGVAIDCPIEYYETPLLFSIETWGEVGQSQSSVAAADLRNTLNFSFTVLDANGRPTDIPVYLVLDGTRPGTVPESGTAALAAAAALALAVARRRRRAQTAMPAWNCASCAASCTSSSSAAWTAPQPAWEP